MYGYFLAYLYHKYCVDQIVERIQLFNPPPVHLKYLRLYPCANLQIKASDPHRRNSQSKNTSVFSRKVKRIKAE